MAESRAQRMRVVLNLAEQQEQAAAQRVSQCQEQLVIEQRQLAELIAYRVQYLQAQGEPRANVQAAQLINFSSFIGRLGEACREQENKIARMEITFKKLQLQWREKYQKRQSIQDLILRLTQEENLILDKRLQKEMDELSAQQLQRAQREE